MQLDEKQLKRLGEKLPDSAVKQHPSKTYLSVIDPMAVIDRLNEVFGVGQWNTACEAISFVGKFAVVKVTFTVPAHGIHLEQFGGNDNTDVGDAYKGAATDALTKIASYLGIGAEIYKGKGNVSKAEPISQKDIETAKTALELATTKDGLKDIWLGLSDGARADEGLKDYSRTLASKLK